MTTTRQQIDTWKMRLLDLSRRNRLLHTRANLGGTVALTHPPAEALFDVLVRRGRKLAFVTVLTLEQQLAALSWDRPATGTTMRLDQLVAPTPKGNQIATALPPADQERVLYNMRLRARTAMSEQGINVLYLALGFLEWFEPGAGETLWRSPLLLLPVELQRAALGAEYTLRLIDDVVLNPTLVHKLRQSFGLALPDLPDDIDELQLEPFFAQIEALIAGRDGWQVAREALLGLFSFQKLLMYHDLAHAAEAPKPHPIIELLAGGGQARAEDAESDKAPSGINLQSLDERPPEQCYQVLDADSSQAEAIEAARRGASFVLQGPPGTGKSQTITNIIAECLAEGKRVLFVSEKMAALQVVFERLKQCGLAEFCLELHSHKASKRAVLDALGASLAAGPPPIDPAFPYDELAGARQQLNAYASALHTPHGPLRWTPFLAHGRLATLADAPDTSAPIGELDSYTAEQLGAIEALLTRLDTRSDLLRSMPENAWRGCAITVSSFEQRGRMRAKLRSLLAAALNLPPHAASAATPLGLPAPENLAAVRALAGLLHILNEPHTAPAKWLADSARAAQRQALIAEAQANYSSLAALEQQLLQRYHEAVLELDLDGLLGRFTTQYATWARVLRLQYHRDIAAIRAALRPGAALAAAQVAGDVKLAIDVRAARRWVEQYRATLADQLTPLFADRATDWAQLETVAAWAAQLMQKLPQPLPAQAAEAATRPQAARGQLLAELPMLDAALARLDAELSFLKELDLANPDLQPDRLEQTLFSALNAQCSLLLERMSDLDAWWEYCDLRRAAEPLRLAAYLDALSADQAAAAQPRRAFHKRFATLWLDAAYERTPVLRRFQRAPHEALIERFRVLDREQLAAAQARLRQLLAARRPEPNTAAVPGSELATLRRELQKQRRHKPIRQLFREIPALLGQLKPCLMMSPLSVSQFLDPDAAPFDLVIFDEASQIRTEDAIGAVLRGQALIVVGDNKQLPPMSFFMTSEEDLDAEDAEVADSFESVLDTASAAGLPAWLLRWHYRSRDESLITFSNTHFYNRRLATFPSAIAVSGRGVGLVHVADGLYDRQGSRTNPIEARRVADLVVEQLKNRPERSLGVVAFGQPQQLAILHELERRGAAEQALAPLFDEERAEPFFVKNLENVQGDERDVMIVSVGYGRDAAGRVLMNFGPLNQQGGERRLNVAITRARDQVVLVSSLLPEDIDTRRTQHPGPRLLRDYLEYARRGGPERVTEHKRQETGDKRQEVESSAGKLQSHVSGLTSQVSNPRFEDKLAVALARRGLVLARQIGHSDFRIDIAVRDPQNPTQFLLGIECDGDDYRDAPTARDRERLREQVLATLGWKIHRAWSAAWARDPEAEIARVFAALETARDDGTVGRSGDSTTLQE